MAAQILGRALGNRLRLAIVGLGKMGRLHLRTWQKFSDVSITVVVDTDPGKAACPETHHLSFLRHFGDLYGKVDAAIIATPAREHVACAAALLGKGIHCLVEKPLAVDYADSAQLVSIAARCGTVLAVGHSERFNPGVRYAQNALTTDIRRVEVFRMGPLARGTLGDADVVQDLMIHDLDWVIDGLRELPREFRIRDARWHRSALSCVSCELLFSRGKRVGLTASSMTSVRRREIQLFLNNGAIHFVDLDSPPNPCRADPLTLQAAAFLAAVGGQVSGIATGVDALAAIALGDEIRALCRNTTALVP